MARKSRKNPQMATEAPQIVKYAAWGYARISVDGERSEDSIESQTAIIQDYANGKSDIDLRGVITDLGFTGRDFDRPGYIELMDGVKSGGVQCIVVKDLSRLGRTYIEVGELLFDILPSYNVRFISVNDRYNSFADDAVRKKLLILFKNLVNDMYSRDMGVKIKSSFALKQQKGELLGSLPPYGYLFTTENGGKHLKIEPESAEIVKLIYDLRAQGNSMVMITDYLNRNGIPAPRNHYYRMGVLRSERDSKKILWQNSYIGQLLRNEVYTGRQIQSKYNRNGKRFTEKPRGEWIIHEDAHPAIIDKEQFDAVQVLLGEAGEKFKKLGNKLDDNIFVGKMFCARCGKALKRQHKSSKNKKTAKPNKYSYICRDCATEFRHTMGLDKIPHFPLEKVEEVITATIQRYMDAFVNIDALLEDIANSAAINRKQQNLTAELSKYRRESKKAEDMLSSAYTHHLAGLLDSREFELARVKFEREKQTAEAGADRVTQELAGYDVENARQNAFLENFRRFRGFSELNRAAIDILILRITIEPLTNIIDITLNFMEDFEKLNKLVEESGVISDVR
jgi:DNA invertase Pin-like site-specific DNA recombinase